jgi:hypothetical protein
MWRLVDYGGVVSAAGIGAVVVVVVATRAASARTGARIVVVVSLRSLVIVAIGENESG